MCRVSCLSLCLCVHTALERDVPRPDVRLRVSVHVPAQCMVSYNHVAVHCRVLCEVF